MGQIISSDSILIPLLEAILAFYNVVPFSNFFTYEFVPTGIFKLAVHRILLQKYNLYQGSWYMVVYLMYTCLNHDNNVFISPPSFISILVLETKRPH